VDRTPEQIELQRKLEPAIKRFVLEVDKLGLQTSALIFSPDGDFLMRCGNAPHEGRDLVRLHYFLSIVCARLEASGHYERTKDFSGPQAPDSQEIADQLALILMQMPKDLIPVRVCDILDDYVSSRRPFDRPDSI
jgi:hypothetical protein